MVIYIRNKSKGKLKNIITMIQALDYHLSYLKRNQHNLNLEHLVTLNIHVAQDLIKLVSVKENQALTKDQVYKALHLKVY
jgi:hypothetical protein